MLIKPPGALGTAGSAGDPARRLAERARPPTACESCVRRRSRRDRGRTYPLSPVGHGGHGVNQFADRRVRRSACSLGRWMRAGSDQPRHGRGPVPYRRADLRLGLSTANFLRAPAMTERQLARLSVRAVTPPSAGQFSRDPIFIGGEMGIGNTTAAAAGPALGRRRKRWQDPGRVWTRRRQLQGRGDSPGARLA